MMRAWRNTLLRFGLVSIPVSVSPAVESKASVTSHTFDRESGERVRQAWTTDGENIAADTFRAYDVDGEAVEIEPPAIDGESEITLEAFVPLAVVDPLFYADAYCLYPGKGGADGLGLVATLLRESDGFMLAGTARFTDRPRSVVIRWSDAASAIVLHTLTFASRVRFEGMAKASESLATPDAALLAQGALLTESLPTTFVPADVDPLEDAIVLALASARPYSTAAKGEPATTAADILSKLRADVDAKSLKGKAKGRGKAKAKA